MCTALFYYTCVYIYSLLNSCGYWTLNKCYYYYYMHVLPYACVAIRMCCHMHVLPYACVTICMC